MRKQVFAGLVCMLFSIQLSAQFTLSGMVTSTAGDVLQGASVSLKGGSQGTTSDQSGKFLLSVGEGNYNVVISYIGFNTETLSVKMTGDRDLGIIELTPRSYKGEEVIISALRAGVQTPVAYTNISGEEIAERNFGQDIPYLIGQTPSMIVSSDAGQGIGYTAMRIRGTDANRINVTVNGIPLNDAESHGVFWVDMPDLATSTNQIQVQRGVGTSTNGAGAFGATVNLQTTDMNKDPYVSYDVSGGSYNTMKNSLSLGTGLLQDRFTIDFRLSDIHSDGYIDRSRADLQSYYLSAGYYGEKSTLKFITFGGFEEVYQAWDGVPSELLSINRTYNGLGAYTDTAGNTAYYENQVDHYDQVHYQLHFNRKFSQEWTMNAALHYTLGKGYYEQYENGEDYAYYGMKYPVVGNDTVFETNLIRRKWLDNDFYGAIASVKYETGQQAFVLGGGWNRYYGLHYGKVIWAEMMGENIPGHQWYEGIGDKTDWNIYSKYYRYFTDRLTGYADLQVRAINHDIQGTDAKNRDVTQQHEYLFFNPKAGITFEPASGQRAFLSYARANREPNRNNYTDAPQDILPVKETLNDVEAGYSIHSKSWNAGITAYYMHYIDQLVLTGQINEVGYPIMVNVPLSYRAGIELEGAFNFEDKIRWAGNLT